MDGKTVGALRVVDAGNDSPKRISPLFILPQHRGRGYAQAAILEAEKLHGSHSWELGTILQETGNCYLYEKMGYHQTDQQTIINDNMTNLLNYLVETPDGYGISCKMTFDK